MEKLNNMQTILICLFITINIYSQKKFNLNNIGVKDFSLETKLNELKKTENIIFTMKSKYKKNINIYSLSDSVYILGVKKQIAYKFAFENNKLVAYTFKILSISYHDYKKLIRTKLRDNKFINKERITSAFVGVKCKMLFTYRQSYIFGYKKLPLGYDVW